VVATNQIETPVADLLAEAEALEARAATERVAFLIRLFGDESHAGQRLLDVGCGNGYAVREWSGRGLVAVGVDISLFRLSRWVGEHPASNRPFVIADATALPFRNGVFDRVVSSGMIEHVEVEESSTPCTVVAQPGREEKRRRVVAEISRDAGPTADLSPLQCRSLAGTKTTSHQKWGFYRKLTCNDSLCAATRQSLNPAFGE
jgi:SAM-dependent methyltransferase